MSTHFESITDQHIDVLKKLQSIAELVLVGGTGLALQLGHRKSYDLDFVTTVDIAEIQLKCQEIFSQHQLRQRFYSPSQLTMVVDMVKITFFHDQPLLYSPSDWDYGKLASVRDIFSSKLFIIGKRATWRDYVDIACLIRSGLVDFSQGLIDAVTRYGVNKKWVLEPMTYFDDVEMMPIEWLTKELTQTQIQELLTTTVSKYLQNR